MKIISIASIKGGVGKTTLAINLALTLSKKYNVLCVDLDSNNNLTDYFLRSISTQELENKNIYHFLSRKLLIQNCIYETENKNISVLPSTLSLSGIGFELALKPETLLTFKPILKKLDYFDIAIIDTPPSLSYEMKAGIYAGDHIICPVSLSRWTFQGVQILTREIESIENITGSKPRFNIVPSMVTKSDLNKLLDIENIPLTRTFISKANPIRTAINNGTELKLDSKSALEFEALSMELIA